MFARSAPVAPAAAVRELMSSCDAMHAELQQLCDVTCAPCMSMTAAGCRARTRRQARQVVQGHVARQRQGAPLYMYLASQAGPQRAFCRACKQTAHPVEESKCSCLCICVQNIALWSASSGFQALAAGAAAAAQRECLLEPCSVWRALTADDCKTAARAAGGQIQWSGPLSGACVNTEPAAERRGGGGPAGRAHPGSARGPSGPAGPRSQCGRSGPAAAAPGPAPAHAPQARRVFNPTHLPCFLVASERRTSAQP